MTNKLFCALFFSLLVAFFCFGCAGSKDADVQFVPIQISWDALNDVNTEDSYVSSCMVTMTNALMAHSEIQKYAGEPLSFSATISMVNSGNSETKSLEFFGACPADAPVMNENLCSWQALCSAEGKIKDLKFSAKK